MWREIKIQYRLHSMMVILPTQCSWFWVSTIVRVSNNCLIMKRRSYYEQFSKVLHSSLQLLVIIIQTVSALTRIIISNLSICLLFTWNKQFAKRNLRFNKQEEYCRRRRRRTMTEKWHRNNSQECWEGESLILRALYS